MQDSTTMGRWCMRLSAIFVAGVLVVAFAPFVGQASHATAYGATKAVIYKMDNGINNKKNPKKAKVGKTIKLKAPHKDGYVFKGWFTNAKKTKALKNSKLKVVNKKSKRTVYAKWEVASLFVKYYMNGGENNASNPDFVKNGKTVKLKNPSKEGYNFVGWFSDKAMTKQVTTVKGKTSKAYRTVYAKWISKAAPKIVYELNGGVNNPKNPTQVEKDASVTLMDASRNGYMFQGWYSDAGLTKKVTEVKGSGDAADRTVYAKWYQLVPLSEAISENVLDITDTSSATLTQYNNVDYKSAGRDGNLHMDIIVPNTKGPKPLIVYVAGGGFTRSNTTGDILLRTEWARSGYVVASLQHQVAPNGKFPSAVQDLKAGIRYLRANADTYGIDKDHVIAVGGSSGGYMVSMLGVTSNTEYVAGTTTKWDVGDNLDQSSAVNGVVDMYGVSDLRIIGAGLVPGEAGYTGTQDLQGPHDTAGGTEALYITGGAKGGAAASSCYDNGAYFDTVNAASPFTYVDANDCPFLFLHGDKDTMVSPMATAELYYRLSQAGVTTERKIVEGAGHGGVQFSQAPVRKAILNFFQSANEGASIDNTDAGKLIPGDASLACQTKDTSLSEPRCTPESVRKDCHYKNLDEALNSSEFEHLKEVAADNQVPTVSVSTVTYKGSGSSALKMEVLTPSVPGKATNKTVVFIQGGGFTGSDPTKNLAVRMKLAEAGYTVASVQHRVVPGVTFPGPVQDVKAAVRYLRAHAADYRINTDELYSFGNSSGGYFALMLGVTSNVDCVAGTETKWDVGDNLDQSSAVKGVIDYYGVSDLSIIGAGLDEGLWQGHHSTATTEALLLNGTAFGNNAGAGVFDTPEKVKQASPFTYINEKSPKFLAFHGDKDTLVSPVATAEVAKRLTEAGVQAKRYTVANAGHGGFQFDQDEIVNKIIDFIG